MITGRMRRHDVLLPINTMTMFEKRIKTRQSTFVFSLTSCEAEVDSLTTARAMSYYNCPIKVMTSQMSYYSSLIRATDNQSENFVIVFISHEESNVVTIFSRKRFVIRKLLPHRIILVRLTEQWKSSFWSQRLFYFDRLHVILHSVISVIKEVRKLISCEKTICI